MKKLWSAVALGLVVSTYALAQGATFTIVPEHRTIIREYVNKEGQPVTITEQVTVGAVVPGEIALNAFPTTVTTQVPEIAKYDFVRWGDQVVVVDPQSRKVVAIVN